MSSIRACDECGTFIEGKAWVRIHVAFRDADDFDKEDPLESFQRHNAERRAVGVEMFTNRELCVPCSVPVYDALRARSEGAAKR